MHLLTLFLFSCSLRRDFLVTNASLSQAFVPGASVMFVSQASVDRGIIQSYEIRKRVEVVKNCRNIGKRDMKYNDLMPKMKVDPERYVWTRCFFVFGPYFGYSVSAPFQRIVLTLIL